MKRTIHVLLALLAVVCLSLPAFAHAEEQIVTIRIGTSAGEVDGVADVPVLLDNCAGVDSVQFDINYDSAALAFVLVTPGDLFEAQYTVTNATEPGRIRVACAGALGLEGPGTLLTIRFRPITSAGSAVTITSGIVTFVDANYNQTEAYVAVENGGVSVNDTPLPEAAVTPWIPVTPVPTPSPIPSPTPEPTPMEAELSVMPSEATPPPVEAEGIPTVAYYAGGGLLLAIIVLVVIIATRRGGSKRHQSDR
ncbi:MAG: cohesin domain-containing protein [Eubacteriales bacterium]